jgi:hypothetical protein
MSPKQVYKEKVNCQVSCLVGFAICYTSAYFNESGDPDDEEYDVSQSELSNCETYYSGCGIGCDNEYGSGSQVPCPKTPNIFFGDIDSFLNLNIIDY